MHEIDWSGFPRHASSFGVDVGSLYLKAVALDDQGEVLWRLRRPHRGEPLALVQAIEAEVRRHGMRFGITGSFNGALSRQTIDSVLCLHEAARKLNPAAANILDIGATHFCLIRLNRRGDIRAIQTNPLCAAGTGSFLDAQAERMGVDIEDLAGADTPAYPPAIATRCAVFAKSDLIHRQQEGFGIPALWSGLCRGLAEGLLQTLTHGSPLSGQTLLCGGVALNPIFVAWLHRLAGGNGNGIRLFPNPELAAALGAGLLGRSGVKADGIPPPPVKPEMRRRRPALSLIKSRLLPHRPLIAEVDPLDNEITVHRLPPEAERPRPVFLGIDIGSTSTKLALTDANGGLIADIYRRTQSDPILATRRLFRAVLVLFERFGFRPVVAGVGTTGSGRKLIGEIVGADLIINEISAHVAGAVRVAPDVETVFEIGGQDAKYMCIQNGRIVDANMNYVCAAGTGSFIEELCAKLEYRVAELGADVLGVAPPYINSRCTVFMEQDIHALLRQGVPRREAAGAIIYSVIENYLHRVVGKRAVNGEFVMFQGATARNPALTAAIEQLLDRRVVVSPYPHAMGAYGAALLVQSTTGAMAGSKFKGFDLASRHIDIDRERCSGCRNRCELTRAVIAGEPKSQLWGMKCGRDENSSAAKDIPAYEVFKRQREQIGSCLSPQSRPAAGGRVVMPMALSAFALGPFWSEFFNRIGVGLVPGPPTDSAVVQRGRQVSASEFCLPVKTALGHIARCLQQYPEYPVFVPHLIADEAVAGLTQTRFCPYLEILPSLIGPEAREKAAGRILSPVVDLRLADEKNARSLAESLAPFASRRVKDVAAALRHARRMRLRLQEEIQSAARARREGLRADNRPAVVVIGRPYNTLDRHLSHQLPYEIAAAGLDVLPLEGLAFHPERLRGYFRNLFWSYGQRIVSALIQIAETEGLYPVYLSNFGCGPDSFILSYAESIMAEKPMLILELDEHGSSGGYLTRLEAFLEVVKAASRAKPAAGRRASWHVPREAPTPADIRERRLCVPHMHPTGSRLLAAALRGEGYSATELPIEDDAAFAEGRRWTRGSECLPAPLTLGSFLKQTAEDRRKGRDPNTGLALFMPTSDGPCRFGQYCALDRMVLDRLGCRELPILSPSSENAYYGLDQKTFTYILLADILFKMRCRVKPREKSRGDAEEALERMLRTAENEIENRRMRLPAFLPQAQAAFGRIPVDRTPRLLVGVVGEIYVRCHAYANHGLVDVVEKLGGEVWLAPATEWIMYTAWVERYRLRRRGMSLWQAARLGLRWHYMRRKEHEAYRLVAPLLADRTEPPLDEIVAVGRRFLPPDFEGESILTLGRAALFKKDGAGLIVNCAPFGCMHGNITSALFNQAAEEIEVPVVNIAYDGVGDANAAVATFMQAALRKAAASRESGDR
jgi:predicted CoA-substrate-specific enzyme activase